MPQDWDPFDGLDELYDPDTVAALDAWIADNPDPGPEPLASRLNTWGRTSTLGLVLSASALGLQEILYPTKDQIVIEVDAAGEPHDLPIRLFLDPDDPSGSLCIVRRDPPPPVI